jgi:hypothetical protein
MADLTIGYNQVAGETDLQVEPIFKALMVIATGRGSLYLRAKETIVDYVSKGELDEREKATLIAKHITDLATSMTAQSLQAAVSVAKENRDAKYDLTKAREETKLVSAQIQKTLRDELGADIQNKFGVLNIKKAQAELYRDYGVLAAKLPSSVLDLALDTDFSPYGTKVESIKMAQANVYNGYSTAYRQNGLVLLTTNSAGQLVAGTEGDTTGLTYWQTKVAERNEQGFDDNMRQHVANSSATMVSMLLTSEDASLTAVAQEISLIWKTAANYLNGNVTP